MYKNIAISLLGAWVLRDVFGTTEVRDRHSHGPGGYAFYFLPFLRGSAGKITEKAGKNPGTGAKVGRTEGRQSR